MNIVKSYPATLTGEDLYSLTKSPMINKMRDAAGTVLEIGAYMVYEDVNSKGEDQTIVSIKTPEGEIYATNSQTFARDFCDMLACFELTGEVVEKVKVIQLTSKKGRPFLTCLYEK